MDLLTLASTAIAMAKPFLEATNDGLGKKIGEDIWNLVKKPFQKTNKEEELKEQVLNDELAFSSQLQQHLINDPSFAKSILEIVTNSQQLLNNSFKQTVTNNEKVEKQLNAQNINGNVSF
jgi:hypothetical protein